MFKAQSFFFTITIFLSAYLLFVVQPLIGKIILPSLGGTPMVWNTSMLFFQILLLGGYLYAHGISQLKSLKVQFFAHFFLVLLAGLSTLPIYAGERLVPDESISPLLWQIKSMMYMVGLPFLFLSATAPLLQKWFSYSDHPDAGNPYFLYASSNLGSVLALLLYPALVERLFPLVQQSAYWGYGYGFLLIFVMVSCLTIFRRAKFNDHHEEPEALASSDKTAVQLQKPDLKTILLWMFLAFVPSSLMIGLTNFITTDIGSMPLFWVIPLALYILSFVIAFAKRQVISLKAISVLFVILYSVIYCMVGTVYFLKLQLGIALTLLFFVTAIMCHMELNRLKPSTKYLTLFYLIMSVGGALGGIFNALIAPVLFLKPYEYIITGVLSLFCWNISGSISQIENTPKNHRFGALMVACILVLGGIAFVILNYFKMNPYVLFLPLVCLFAIPFMLFLIDRRKYFIIAAIIMAIATPLVPWNTGDHVVDISRNYFGTLITTDSDLVRNLSHGTTLHGSQPLDPQYQNIPLTYFNPVTAIGQNFEFAKSYKNQLNVAVLGLGTGSVNCLLRDGDHVDFYEIDPDIVRIATDPQIFSYLDQCKTEHEIILGDARLKLENAEDHSYDLILIDVFSSDNIPMHLMSVESTRLALQKLKEDGILVFHITSRYYALKDEVFSIMNRLEIPSYFHQNKRGEIEGTPYQYEIAQVVSASHNPFYLNKLQSAEWQENTGKILLEPWTDDFANPLRAVIYVKRFLGQDDRYNAQQKVSLEEHK